MSWRYTHTPDGWGRVEVDGQDVSRGVMSARVDAEGKAPPTITLEAAVYEVDIVGEEDPTWVGLERIPHRALLDELASRSSKPDVRYLLKVAGEWLDREDGR